MKGRFYLEVNEKYVFTVAQLNNLITFLNRVTNYEGGLKDVQAMNEIMHVLNNPIKDERTNNQ